MFGADRGLLPKPANELEKPISEKASRRPGRKSEHVQAERVRATERERPVSGIAEADIALRVVPLSRPARIEVRRLACERVDVVIGPRTRRVDQHARIGVEASFHDADQRPAVTVAEIFSSILRPMTDVPKRIGRPEPMRIVAVLLDRVVDFAGARIPRDAMGLVAIAPVERSIEGDARVGQLAVVCRRVQIGPKAAEAIRDSTLSAGAFAV